MSITAAGALPPRTFRDVWLISAGHGLTHWYPATFYILLPLITRFDRFHEYIFLLAIGWCLGLAEAASALGLSAEIGAFLAGITIATSPISQYIAVNLKPLCLGKIIDVINDRPKFIDGGH